MTSRQFETMEKGKEYKDIEGLFVWAANEGERSGSSKTAEAERMVKVCPIHLQTSSDPIHARSGAHGASMK